MLWLPLVAAVGPTDAAAVPVNRSVGVAVFTKKLAAIARRRQGRDQGQELEAARGPHGGGARQG